MSVFSGCRNLASCVLKRSVFLGRNVVVCRNVFREQRHSVCSTRRFTPVASASRQQRPHVFTCQPNARRCSSEARSGNSGPEKEAEVPTEESHEGHGELRAPVPSFTLDVLVALLRQENAEDICVIKVSEQIKYATYFIVVSGTSQRHLRAMALYAIKVYKYLKKDSDPHVTTEGKDAEDWMCIDFGNIVVHFMLPETRDVYELEKLWTLRSYDEQLRKMPVEKLPVDFIYDAEVTK